jgi:8-oxo-dGTP pyrophosphatase MutT (NUDIX family)
MWIMTPAGFFSVVQKPDDALARTLTVRARVKADLEALRVLALPELGPIEAHMGTDYAFRARAPQDCVARALGSLVMGIAYNNFKDEVSRVQGDQRASTYGRVWQALHGLQHKGSAQAAQPNPGAPWSAHRVACVPQAHTYGGLVVDAQHRVLLREPTRHFGGYVWTFAKGRPNRGETPAQTAVREVAEETGVNGQVVGSLPFVYGGSTSTTAYFVMRDGLQRGAWDAETASIWWASLDDARTMLGMTEEPIGRARDLQVLADLTRWMQDHPGAFATASGVQA